LGIKPTVGKTSNNDVVLSNIAFVLINNAFDLTNIAVVLAFTQAFETERSG
jgi:hypothetical protein